MGRSRGRAAWIARGGVEGALAGAAYALVECVFATLLPWGTSLARGALRRTVPDAGLAEILLIAWPALGALAGALLALCHLPLLSSAHARASADRAGALPAGDPGRPRDPDRAGDPARAGTPGLRGVSPVRSLRAALAGVLAVGFAANAGTAVGEGLQPLVLWLLAAGFAVAWLVTLRLPRIAAGIEGAVGPWSASLSLVGVTWILQQALPAVESRALKALALAAWLALVGAGGVGLHRLHRRRRDATRAPAWLWRRAGATTAALVVAGLLAARAQRPGAPPLPAPVATAAAAEPTNVVLISLDTVRADHLSLYGYARATTPTLDALEAGTRYTRAYATSAFTLATHASLFTGLYTSEHGAHLRPPGSEARAPREGRPMPLAAGFTTLAEHLQGRGFRTLAVVANTGFLGPALGLAQGFDHYDARGHAFQPFGTARPAWLLRRPAGRALKRVLAPGAPGFRTRDAAAVTDAALRLLDRVAGDPAPFLLFLNYMDAHNPMLPPPPYDALFPGRDPCFSWADDYYPLRADVAAGRRDITARERAHLLSQYDGAIAYIDAQLGRLLERLRREGLFDPALVIVTSDHGEAFGARQLFGHNSSVYQDQIHVPLLVKAPGQRGRRDDATPVSVVDLFPTVLEAAGLEPPPGTPGQSLLHPPPAVASWAGTGSGGRRAAPDAGASSPESRVLLAESYPADTLLALHPRFRRVERAAVSGSLKLIHASDGRRELYDLEIDPAETRDLYRPDDPRARRLETALDSWLARTLPHTPGAPEAGALDSEDEERLRALGYLE